LPHAGMFRRLIVVFLFTFAPKEAHFEEGARGSGDYCIFPPPDGGVFHAVALEVVCTRLLQRGNTVVSEKSRNKFRSHKIYDVFLIKTSHLGSPIFFQNLFPMAQQTF
jgi:hypothetical protein